MSTSTLKGKAVLIDPKTLSGNFNYLNTGFLKAMGQAGNAAPAFSAPSGNIQSLTSNVVSAQQATIANMSTTLLTSNVVSAQQATIANMSTTAFTCNSAAVQSLTANVVSTNTLLKGNVPYVSSPWTVGNLSIAYSNAVVVGGNVAQANVALTVTGDSAFTGNLTAQTLNFKSALLNNGSPYISSQWQLANIANAQVLSYANAVSIGNSLTVLGNTSVSGALNANLILQGGVPVSTLSSLFTIANIGNTAAQGIYYTKNVAIGSNVVTNSALTVVGDSVLQGNLTTSTVSAAKVLQNNVAVTSSQFTTANIGNSSNQGIFYVGPTALGSNVLPVNTTLVVTGNTTITGSLNASTLLQNGVPIPLSSPWITGNVGNSSNQGVFYLGPVAIGSNVMSNTALAVTGDLRFTGNLYQGANLFTSGTGAVSNTFGALTANTVAANSVNVSGNVNYGGLLLANGIPISGLANNYSITLPQQYTSVDWALSQTTGPSLCIYNKPNIPNLPSNLATVASTGSYSDLSGTPQLAQVAYDGTYSSLVGAVNAVSQLQNDSHYITNSGFSATGILLAAGGPAIFTSGGGTLIIQGNGSGSGNGGSSTAYAQLWLDSSAVPASTTSSTATLLSQTYMGGTFQSGVVSLPTNYWVGKTTAGTHSLTFNVSGTVSTIGAWFGTILELPI